MEPILSFVAIALLVGGLVGHGFELRKIRSSIRTDEALSSQKIFSDRRNFKWYGIIAAGFILWYAANRL